MGPILRTPEEGIDTIIWLATARRDEIGNGLLFLDRRPRPFDRVPSTRLERARAPPALGDGRPANRRGGDPAPD